MAELRQVEKENLSARVYGRIRRALIDGQFEPGERLRISALAADLGTSITPVREAIFRLVSEQALEMKAATAVHVPMLDSRRLREIQLVRMELEGAAAARAAGHITDQQIQRLEQIQEDFIEGAQDPKKASLGNRDFHFALMEVAGLPLVESIVENMWTLMGPLLGVFHGTVSRDRIDRENHPHYAVLRALKARDPEKARHALQEDIRLGLGMADWLDQRAKAPGCGLASLAGE
ncbi:GntR family transcriptional regulator [Xanthobacter dioxanivorans]|uniref:GntR family transcriptional regulator n=1 Tax=Xanthobacter dioxanivorans TaxID=2528964 RepID=A0A974PRG3_9HYPH|nr:GntR family transcriptional regulator [Xanthobacter dioxanivorans]QRG07805.1 GntR family transcriptional regulator [Xanthobacter dioxanivorans]